MGDTFEVVGVDHVQVTAPEELLDQTCEWYRSCLGLQDLPKPEGTRPRGAWFGAGGQEVHVSIDEHNPHKTAHFCVVVTDHAAAVERLRGSGCHIEQAGSIPGRHRFYTRDPAGNRIEIMSFDSEGTST